MTMKRKLLPVAFVLLCTLAIGAGDVYAGSQDSFPVTKCSSDDPDYLYVVMPMQL